MVRIIETSEILTARAFLLVFNENAAPPSWLAPGCDRDMGSMTAVFQFATLGRLVAALFERSEGTLVLSRHSTEGDDGEFTLDFRGDRLRAFASRTHLTEALEKAIDFQREKTCRRCKKSLPVEAFSRSRGEVDGRLYRCRQCERTRLKKYHRKFRIVQYQSGERGYAGIVPAMASKTG